jgi:hypothetical protein
MAVGAVWYSPAGFYKTWQRLARVKTDSENMSIATMTRLYGTVFLASVVTAYVLAHVTFLSNNLFHTSFLQDALATSFWMWLGFTATRFYVHDAFEGRPLKLTVLHSGHELATLLVMGLIMGLMGV